MSVKFFYTVSGLILGFLGSILFFKFFVNGEGGVGMIYLVPLFSLVGLAVGYMVGDLRSSK